MSEQRGYEQLREEVLRRVEAHDKSRVFGVLLRLGALIVVALSNPTLWSVPSLPASAVAALLECCAWALERARGAPRSMEPLGVMLSAVRGCFGFGIGPSVSAWALCLAMAVYYAETYRGLASGERALRGPAGPASALLGVLVRRPLHTWTLLGAFSTRGTILTLVVLCATAWALARLAVVLWPVIGAEGRSTAGACRAALLFLVTAAGASLWVAVDARPLNRTPLAALLVMGAMYAHTAQTLAAAPEDHRLCALIDSGALSLLVLPVINAFLGVSHLDLATLAALAVAGVVEFFSIRESFVGSHN